MFVVCVTTHLQDGTEYFSTIVATTEDALTYINGRNCWKGDHETYQLFRLGEEIPLECTTVEVVTRQVRDERRFVIKKGKQ